MMAQIEGRPRTVSILPGVMLRVEGIAALLVTIALYAQTGASWWLFLALLFVPDLAFIGIAISREFATLLYNIVHTYTLPLLLGLAAVVLGANDLLPIVLIWGAHISLDRAVGYGLKYSLEPKNTHLDRA